LDPFDQYDDATLNDALRAAGLFELQSEMDDDRITLDTQVSSGGGNLSVGQRQILALARAIVRGSKLLILDEGMCSCDCPTLCVWLNKFCTIVLQPLPQSVSLDTEVCCQLLTCR
jgi:ABC-type multidrug transport system fused ATPase/permease subunit